MKNNKFKTLTEADEIYSLVVDKEKKLGQYSTNEVAINEFIAEGIKFGKNKESANLLELLKLKCKCRIRGLEIDKSNGYKVDIALIEYQELLRHLEQINFIIADIDCALKYLNPEEKFLFEKLKKYYEVDNEK